MSGRGERKLEFMVAILCLSAFIQCLCREFEVKMTSINLDVWSKEKW